MSSTKPLDLNVSVPVPLGDSKQPDAVHLFNEGSVLAINAALMANRPLLVRGEPGAGKSQLARAAAHVLEREFVHTTLTIRTEIQDLFWQLDAVKRLAEAQLVGAVVAAADYASAEASKVVEERLAVGNFVEPGPLWWAFDWSTAKTQYERAHPTLADELRTPKNNRGVVVLLDEIDKADSAVPNGLLEALGNRAFPGPGEVSRIQQNPSLPPPLVVITTNEERTLPNAFLRRCLVLHLALPEPRDKLCEYLMTRGRAHFTRCLPEGVLAPSETLLETAADMLFDDRDACRTPPRPGQAEYLDLLRAVCRLEPTNEEARLGLLKDVRPLTFAKYQGGSASSRASQAE